jgi:hypothetical protein
MDDLEFPRFMCRKGGSWELETGMYSVRTVADQTEAKQALAEGWLFSQYDEPANDEAPQAAPTRAQLEARAKELGLTWHHKTGDKKLAEMIAAAS